ncbi:MAG: hypothetical protein HYV19_05745 [Gemmatimonadetes bacterium]|nr:hypothetical protein [Gemmatimonadota bacterium]
MRSLLLALCLTACGTDTTGLALGENIDVRLGTSIQMPGDTLSVKFTDVTADSRCPTGVQCVWAGEATTLFTVNAGDPVTLTLGADAAKARVITHGYQVTLVGLKPYPTSSGPIAKADYVATIQVTSAKD